MSIITCLGRLTMMERQEWLVPYLDGQPRIQKPPLIAWLTRASFELFGVSLISARAIGIAFAAFFVLAIALIGLELGGSLNYGLSAGLVALSTAWLAVQSKILLHDIPTAAFSTLALFCFLKWRRSEKVLLLVAIASLLSAGFLTKGPFAFVVFGSGVAALVSTDPEWRRFVRQKRMAILLTLLISIGVSALWFVYVYFNYPVYTAATFGREFSARQPGQLNLQPLLTVAWACNPWQFVLFASLLPSQWRAADQGEFVRLKKLLVWWLVVSLLPFIFFTFAGRYAIGSLVPISLLCALAFDTVSHRLIWVRLGFLVTSVIALLFAAFSWWFKVAGPDVALVLLAYGLFAYFWWSHSRLAPMAITASLLWTTLIGMLYPALGANDIPSAIAQRVTGRRVVLYGDRRPALLPILMRRSLELKRDGAMIWIGGENPWIFVAEGQARELEEGLKRSGVQYQLIDSYKALPSMELAIKSLQRGFTRAQWALAFRSRSLEPVKETVFLYRVG